MITPVGELEHTAAAGQAGRRDLAGDLQFGVVKDGDQTRIDHRVKDFQSRKACHVVLLNIRRVKSLK
jgi:hypothetical protein